MAQYAMVVVAGLGAVAAIAAIVLLISRRRGSLREDLLAPVIGRLDSVAQSLESKFTAATADMASRLEQTRGDLRQEAADRMSRGFREVTESIQSQLTQGRQEQADALRLEIGALAAQTGRALEAIRAEVDRKLLAIGNQVQEKLDLNIKEGFAQFEKVQQHLQAAQQQLKDLGAIGQSISDLNSLLKLPHLRGKFGEASLERLLEDFLPAHMYERNAAIGDNGRVEFAIRFPERKLPIDSKFPREQVLPLFETSDPVRLHAARERFVQVMKEQGKRIAAYIQPENGTTDMALMFLPSETLYMEAVLNGELSEWLNKQRIFPVSPNTLIVTLQSIQMVFKMYEFAKSFEKATEELRKAQKSFGDFEHKFEDIGKSLDRAQTAYGTARRHLTTYRQRVTDLTGEPVPELEGPEPAAE